MSTGVAFLLVGAIVLIIGGFFGLWAVRNHRKNGMGMRIDG